MSEVDNAERLSRKRTGLFYVSATLFMLVSFMDFPARRGIGFTLVWILWAAVLLLNIGGGGGWLVSRSTRRMMEDEVTRAHRARSIAIGYFAALAAALILMLLVRMVAIDVQTVILSIVTAGISAALISFAALERTSMRDG